MITVNNNPLGLIMNVVESLGLEVTYAYDDLVFVAHSAFLFQMDKNPQVVNLYFNQQSDINARAGLAESLIKYGQENGLTIMNKGIFAIEQQEEENLKITFSH